MDPIIEVGLTGGIMALFGFAIVAVGRWLTKRYHHDA